MYSKKKVIIIGGGFAGIHLVRNLDPNIFDVTLIDKQNHHQFQPLFYQVATSQIEPSSISFPFRHIFKKKRNVQIRMAEVLKIDDPHKRVFTTIGEFEYDYLVIATGCKTNFFGNDEIAQYAMTLKTTYDAITIRNRIVASFEEAVSATAEERELLLNLVIVGAGPTGVELAGAFAEIKSHILPKDYPGIDFSKFNIFLIEGSKNTLNSMSENAREASRRYLEKMGVKIITEVFVKQYDGKMATLSTGETIRTKNLIWAAGVTGNLFPGIPEDLITPANRIKVSRTNQVVNFSSLFAVGDIAYMETPKYLRGHPQLANVAINQAKLLARNLRAREMGKPEVEFEYVDRGSMATIGKNKAVVDLPSFHFKGYFAWLVWMFLHLMFILSVRNKLIIFINWAWNYITRDTSLRLILTPPEKRNNGS